MLLVGPAPLAFLSGGYFDGPRPGRSGPSLRSCSSPAAGPQPLPRLRPGPRWRSPASCGSRPGRALSLTWAPFGGPATDSPCRLLLYVGALLAGRALLHDPRQRASRRAGVRPRAPRGRSATACSGGCCRGSSISADPSRPAGGWSSRSPTGTRRALLAAMGFVLCARLAGDGSRPGHARPRGRLLRAARARRRTCPTRAAPSLRPRWGSWCSSPPRRRGPSCAARP